MSPTLRDGQRLIIIKCAYGFRKPRNIYEVPAIGTLIYYLVDEESVNSVLKEHKSFEYFSGSLPERGDIVALNMPGNDHYHAVKRCIAIAHDSIPGKNNGYPSEIIPFKGMVINAKTLTDDQTKYLQHQRDFKFNAADSTFTALDDFIYIVGDNDKASLDSRSFGPIPMNLVFGRVIAM